MRGTPGFNGERLREAREVRDLTAVSLADTVGVSAQTISLYENGKSSPSPDTLETIAARLNLPEHFFIRATRPGDDAGTIFFRSMASTTKRARVRAERRFAWLRDIVEYLSEYIALPMSNFPDLRVPDNPLVLDDDDIEQVASAVRRHWGMGDGPIANMVLLLENQGAVVARDRLGAESLDGLSAFVPSQERPYVVIGTDKGTPVRWRFDAAHELGHVLLHANLQPDVLRRPEHFKRIEEQAHRFAGAFLLPAAPFGDDLFAANLDALRAIKPKWKVSIGMMITRARQLGFITDETTRKLWINSSRRGWRRVEPYDAAMEPEEPRLLRRSVELVLENGAQTADDVAARLSLPLSDVEALCGLPPGYLGSFAPVILKAPHNASQEVMATPGKVIPLPFRRRTI